MATLVLLDGHSLAYRAFYALPTDLATKAGTVTNAVFGFTSMLVKLMSEEKPEYLAVAFDAPVRTFRYDLDPEYKAGRKETPQLFASQMPLIREVLETMEVPQLCVEGVEADDVIATLAEQARGRGWRTVISTGDKDLTQLVNDRVLWVNTMSGDKLDPAGVKAKFGVPPELIVDYLALMGDAVDNVPGVDKVGPKTACKLIEQYGSLEGVIAHAGEVKGVVGENLRKVLDWLPTGRKLLTVKTDVELPFEMESLIDKGSNDAKLGELYGKFGFRTLRDALTNKEDAPEGGASAPLPGDKAKTDSRNFRITVKNMHERAVQLVVHDQIPVSQNQDIKVDIVGPTSPTKKDIDDKRGIIAFESKLEPEEERVVEFGYRVIWPGSRSIVYR